jgi:NADH-quinone oxidoreductase subunit C
MSERALERVKAHFGERVLESSSFRGDDTCVVAPADWLELATFLRDDPECNFDHFVDITAVDYPEREPEQPRFDLKAFSAVERRRGSRTIYGKRVETCRAVGPSLPSPT